MSLKTKTKAQKEAAYQAALRDLEAGIEAQRQLVAGAH